VVFGPKTSIFKPDDDEPDDDKPDDDEPDDDELDELDDDESDIIYYIYTKTLSYKYS
jgi:hypothetical protein